MPHEPFHPKETERWIAIQQNQPGAFQDLYVEYADMLFNYGCKITRDTSLVKDSIQDVFEQLWNKRNAIQIKSSLKSYILLMYRRNLIDKLQAAQKGNTKDVGYGFELSIESKIILEESQHQMRQELNQAIDSLSPRQKEILFLRYYENLPYAEISEMMSLNTNSMYKLLSAAIGRLKDYMTCLIPASGALFEWLG